MKVKTKQQIMIGLMLVSLLGVLGCTKERPFDALPKFEVLAKDQVGTVNEDFLLTTSTGLASRHSVLIRPYELGDTRRVQFQWDKDKLRILKPDGEEQFDDNPTNMVPVIDIPVKYLAYRCAEDPFGECQNREETNDEIEWFDKPYVELDLEGVQLLSEGLLPNALNIAGFACLNQAGKAKVIESQFSPDVVSFTLEMTFDVNIICAENYISFFSFSDLKDKTSVKIQRSFTFVKATTLLTKDYQPISYEEGSADQSTYGYFTTEYQKLDVDNRDVQKSRKTLMNRWAPGQTVVYYLSDSFDKYPDIKQATYESFKILNDGLKKAGATIKLELRESVGPVNASDMLKNMVILVDDPMASSVLGYGPVAADPKTGEIFNARNVMYLGNMKKYLRITYDEMVKSQKNKDLEKETIAELAKTFPTLRDRLDSKSPKKSQSDESAPVSASANQKTFGHTQGSRSRIREISKARLNQLETDKRSLRDILTSANGMVDLMELNIRQSAYPAEMFDFLGVVENGAFEILQMTQFKPWDQLTESEKEKVVEVLLPYVWIPTFIHEMGHNLGLRHNFAGSEDHKNFYSSEELKEMGVNTRLPYQFSSVMDYPYGELEPLRVLGKYDIEALRYGYARQLQTVDGQLINIPTTLEDLKSSQPQLFAPFGSDPVAGQVRVVDYCTDEHVAPNPNCNRFDRGTNLIEIARHYVESYEERYKLINFRNQRADFSLNDDHNLYSSAMGQMMPLRNMYERYESIKNTFDIGANDPQWETDAFLKEVKTSALEAADFFMEILETPDLSCIIVSKANPAEIAGVVKLSEFAPRATNCYPGELDLNPNFKVVAHFGKLFESKKSSDNPNAYVDQIDVKGVWAAKLVAADMLLKREFGMPTMDRYTESPMDMAEIRQKAVPLLQRMFTDTHTKLVDLEVKNGAQVKQAVEAPYKLGTQTIHRSLSPAARILMDLPDGVTTLQEELAERILKNASNDLHSDFVLEDLVKVYKSTQDLPLPVEEYKSLNIGNRRFFAGPGNLVGSLIMDQIAGHRVGITNIDRNRLIDIAELRRQNKTEDIQPQNPAEEFAAQVDVQVLISFIREEVSSQEYLEATLISLSKVSERDFKLLDL